MALSKALIVEETLALIDDEGLGAASMRAIAGRLGVQAMSLYKYFDTRDRLFDAVVERIVAELDRSGTRPGAEDGWRPFLEQLARGVRGYALAHPHAFPLVTTRPSQAPWVNPPLRSLPWIEHLLATLAGKGFDDEQTVFAYRSFNSFLLGFLLLETGALTVQDPQPGDGTTGADTGGHPEPVPGGLSPTRSDPDERAIAQADTPREVIDPQDTLDADRYPHIHRLAVPLAEEHFDDEFDAGLSDMLDRIADHL